jgi:hypothetical protein
MEQEELTSNLCTDLVSLKRHETELKRFLNETPPGRWVPVSALRDVPETVVDSLMATWLPSPGDLDYVVILFLDDATKWSQTADYNATRLLGRQVAAPLAIAG